MPKNTQPTNKHTLTFEGTLPADEMQRAQVLGSNPAISEARTALENAFREAGHPHTSTSHVVRPRTQKAADPEL